MTSQLLKAVEEPWNSSGSQKKLAGETTSQKNLAKLISTYEISTYKAINQCGSLTWQVGALETSRNQCVQHWPCRFGDCHLHKEESLWCGVDLMCSLNGG